jgi:hypothetical protein
MRGKGSGLASNGVGDAPLLAFRLDAMHGIVIKETRITRTALEVPEPLHGQTVLQSAI